MEDNRIATHPILAWNRGDPVHVTYDGKEIAAYPQETVAMALYAAGVKQYSTSSRFYRPRCLYAMPICSEVDPEMIEVSSGHTVRCHLFSRPEETDSKGV